MKLARRLLAATVVATAATAAATAASAACEAGKAADDLSLDEAQALYDCLAPEMLAGYRKGPKMWIPADRVQDYRSWTSANTRPARPGFHDNRFLSTWVNPVGAAEYLRYDEENAKMPAGSIIAKESFAVNNAGKATPGPLFFMEKVAEGVSPETGDWYYYMIAPNGVPQAVNVVSACAECHMGNFGDRDSLGFPIEEVRLPH